MNVSRSVKKEIEALWGGGKGKLLVVIATGWGLLNGMRMVYPVLLPYIRESFGLSLSIGGLLVSILWLGSAVGQLPGGIIADRHSERLVMAASTTLVAAALVVVVIAPTPVILFAASGLVGLGQSLYPIARITSLSDIYPGRIGSALGVTMATGDLGQTILPPIAVALAGAFVWQAGLGWLIPLFLLIGVVIWVALPSQTLEEPAENTSPIENSPSITTELRHPNMVFMGFILFLYMFVWQSFTGLYPTYLVEVKGLSSSVAGVLFSLFFALGVIVKPLAGKAYDRIGARGALISVLVGPVAGFALLPAINTFWPLTIVTALVSSMLGSGAITQSFLADSFSEELRGTGLGVIRTTAAILGATGPVLFGVIADYGYFDEGYILLAIIMVVAILLTVRISRTEHT